MSVSLAWVLALVPLQSVPDLGAVAPLPAEPSGTSSHDPNKVKHVEKHMTLWRGLA